MLRDPIVEEVHRIREQMWDECGGNLERLIESLRASEGQHQDRIISKEDLDCLRQQEPISGPSVPLEVTNCDLNDTSA